MCWQAEILREWNQLEAALSCIQESIKQCEQLESALWPAYLRSCYSVLLRVCLSCREYKRASLAFQEIERLDQKMNQMWNNFRLSLFTTIDQVRLWIACGELDRATRWAQELDFVERQGTPFAREREEVACARVLLARQLPHLALQRLEPVLQRAAIGQRWGHVIEIRLLQAQAYHMLHEKPLALSALSEAVRLGEPGGYLCTFVDEGEAIAALLSKLREEKRKAGENSYLDRLLAAFPQESKVKQSQPRGRTVAGPLLNPLSERELEVLQLLAEGQSNQQIAQELVIALDTVKRHVSHIFSKLAVNNRVQAIRQARDLGLLDQEF